MRKNNFRYCKNKDGTYDFNCTFVEGFFELTMMVINDTDQVLSFAMKSSYTTHHGNHKTIHKNKDAFVVQPFQIGVYRLNRHASKLWTLQCRMGKAASKRQIIGTLSSTKNFFESHEKNMPTVHHFLTQGYKDIVL